MDRIERHGWLDWWANRSTVLGSVEATVTITSAVDGWHAIGRLLTGDSEEREGFAFFCALDPVWSLRFDDDSTITVNVELLEDPSEFQLTEYTGPTQRRVTYTMNTQDPNIT